VKEGKGETYHERAVVADEELWAVWVRAGVGWRVPCLLLRLCGGGGFGLADVGKEGVPELGAGRVAGAEHARLAVAGEA
jgi:hypothetical protein